ncbi:MAG: hypothetical protein ACPGRD_08425, partial [Planktomarina sp.]
EFKGKVTIRSDNGYVAFENRNGVLESHTTRNCGYCIGTTIDIVLSTDRMPRIEEIEEDFQW